MINKILLYLSSISLLVLIDSCNTINNIFFSKKHAAENNLTPAEKVVVTNLLIEGKKNDILGNYNDAETNFKTCLLKDPDNDACMYELANIYFLKKNFSSSVALLKDAVKLNPDNEWYQMQLVKVYEQTRKYDEAINIYENLVKKFPDRIDFYYNLASAYLMSGKYNNAIKTYNDLEAKTGVNEDMAIQKKNIYLSMNKLEKAVNEIQKLIDRFPSEIKYYNLKADIYLANKYPDKAFDIYIKILKIKPEDANVHLSLAEYYRMKGDKVKSFDELKIAFTKENLSIDPKITILLSYYLVTENFSELKEQAYTLADILIRTHPDEPKAFAIYGDFLARDKKLNDAREKYKKVISLDSSQYTVWEQLLLIESELKDYKAQSEESSKAMELFPFQPLPYLLNGDANFRLKNYNKAIRSLEKGAKIADNNDNSEILVQFYSYLGDAYNEIKNYGASDSSYQKALSIKPDDYGVLNNYAYYLSLRGENLDKAEEMAKKAVELSPNSSSYLDTYGWVLYKAGKLDKAKAFIEKALEKGGSDNDIILEHYGDILYKTGHTAKAIEYWKKAREAGSGTELLEKKINESKLIE